MTKDEWLALGLVKGIRPCPYFLAFKHGSYVSFRVIRRRSYLFFWRYNIIARYLLLELNDWDIIGTDFRTQEAAEAVVLTLTLLNPR